MRRSVLFWGASQLIEGVPRGRASTVAAISLATVLGCSSNAEESREQQCERLRDRVVEMRVAAIPRSVQPPAEDLAHLGGAPPPKNAMPQQPDVEGHRAALKQALGHGYIESCVATLTTAQLECSLGASDTEALTACQTTNR